MAEEDGVEDFEAERLRRRNPDFALRLLLPAESLARLTSLLDDCIGCDGCAVASPGSDEAEESSGLDVMTE